VNAITLKEFGSFLFVDSSVKRSNTRKAYGNAVSFICNSGSDFLQYLFKQSVSEYAQKAERTFQEKAFYFIR